MDMGSGAGNGRRLGCRGRGSSCSVLLSFLVSLLPTQLRDVKEGGEERGGEGRYHFHSSADTKMNPKACFVVLAAVVVAVLLGTFARRIGIVRSRV